MITKDNFKELLLFLNFEERGQFFVKQFDTFDVTLEVDFDNQRLIYPEGKGLIVNQRQTCNFSSNENFVVFECVHRLLEKGYKPEHIELEPRWKVGHGASGGRADILIKDNGGKSLLIIECKTAGREFSAAWRHAQNGVSQLFTYHVQTRDAKFLCLYASDFTGSQLSYDNYIITLKDNEKLLEEKKDLKPLTYKDASEVEDLFKVWKETYALDYATKGIFENDIQAYHIGKNKYTTADLNVVGSDKDIQSKYHEFATILRQHNVSGRENAFDKLVNLFLCKIVDEARNAQDLKFYWKGIAYDSPFDLQDRLQKLYKDGMNEFLGEEVTYVDEKTIKSAFHFVKSRPDATQKKVLEYFRELKFFTNNDFAFLDVHNENLFHQNFEVLLKIVKMLQDLRLQSEHQNQFLGDMFEGFLDQGVKQSEGQYFTPSPITKFILMSLPLEAIISNSEKPPRAIDYACGAGHFLNELALQIKPLVEKSGGDVKEFYRQIYGIEKEYRLSKVAKVSAFMYGQDEIQIVYGDALAQLEKNKHKAAAEIKNNSFDLLVANPPYSVKGFLETLSETERAEYSLLDTIDEKSFASNNAIETFFIERAQQLLKSGGVAGIIAPSSILNKGNQKYPVHKKNNYVATREILLQFFDIIGIVELGSQTFGKTGTNTVILFLRRKDNNPAPADHYRNRVDDWFESDDNQAVFKDEHFIRNYCTHIEIEPADYRTLLDGEPSATLLEYEMFQDYRREFDNLTSTKNLKKQKQFKAQNDAERKERLDKAFLEYVREIEKDKLLYFTLASDNAQKVVIVKSPAGNKQQKEFLGYEWSNAKGNEGIKYFADDAVPSPAPIENEDGETDADTERIIENQNNLSRIRSALYDPNDRANPLKINSYIERNYKGEEFEVPESLAEVLSVARLVDMLDFSRTDFNKAFSLTPRVNTAIETKWDLVKLGEVAEIVAGQSPASSNYNEQKNGLPFYQGKKDFGDIFLNPPMVWTTQITKEAIKGDIVMSVRAPVGDVNINPFEKICIGRGLGAIRSKSDVLQGYLFEFISQNKFLFKGNQGATFESISRGDLLEIKIPLPPKEVQTQIVAECEAVDAEVETARKVLVETKEKIGKLVIENDFNQCKLRDIVQKVNDTIDPQTQSGRVFYIGLENIESNTGKLTGDCLTEYSNIKSTKIEFQQGDVLYGKLRPNLNKVYLATCKGICSTDILVFRFQNEYLAKYYSHYFLTQKFNLEVLKDVSGQQLPRTSWTKMEIIEIPVPPLTEQEKIAQQIEILEAQISDAQATIDGAAARKQAIMKKYL